MMLIENLGKVSQMGSRLPFSLAKSIIERTSTQKKPNMPHQGNLFTIQPIANRNRLFLVGVRRNPRNTQRMPRKAEGLHIFRISYDKNSQIKSIHFQKLLPSVFYQYSHHSFKKTPIPTPIHSKIAQFLQIQETFLIFYNFAYHNFIQSSYLSLLYHKIDSIIRQIYQTPQSTNLTLVSFHKMDIQYFLVIYTELISMAIVGLQVFNLRFVQMNTLKPITKRFSVNESKFLGKGCFGFVYEGYDNQADKVIAVKHLMKPQNFEGEIQTLEKLSTLTHPYIMGFYGYFLDKEDVYIFMEFCSGGVLTDLIKKKLDEEEVLTLFRQLVEGMCYMNAKGIMHRDLKPDNILLGGNKDVKISDFGLATVDNGLEKTSQMGTPLYAGPQIYINFTQDYNFTCDVWSAGLILHEMLTTTHPFDHVKNIEQLKKQWRMYEKGQKRIKLPVNLHPQWDYLVNIMLTFNFKKRPTFHQILQTLKKLDENGTMRKQIRDAKKGIKIEGISNQPTVSVYLSFLEQKFDILMNLTETLTPTNYPSIKQCLQDLMIFLLTARYIVKMRNIIRSLKFKNMKYPNGQQLLNSKNPDNKVELIMNQYRNVFDVKLTKNVNFLKEKIIPKLSAHQSKPEQLKLLKNVESAYKLFQQVKQSSYDVEQTYEQQYIKLLSYHKIKPTEQKLKSMSIGELRMYARILQAGLLSVEFSDKIFDKYGYIRGKIADIDAADHAKILTIIEDLKKQLK